jgi:hypothetical protein
MKKIISLFAALSILSQSGCSSGAPEIGPEMDDIDSFYELYEQDIESRVRNPRPSKTSPVVFPHESRNGVWSGNNEFGFASGFAPDSDNRQTILKLDEMGMPQVWTVMLGLDYNAEEFIPSSSSLDIIAEVSVGSGGTTQDFSIDWRQGTQFSMPMNAITIRAAYLRATNIDDIDLRLSARIGKGTTVGASPTLTPVPNPIDNVLIGGAANQYNIPEYATHVQFFEYSNQPAISDNALFSDNTYISFRDGGVFEAAIRGDRLLNFGNGFPIPGHARIMEVKNIATPASGIIVPYMFMWKLDL